MGSVEFFENLNVEIDIDVSAILESPYVYEQGLVNKITETGHMTPVLSPAKLYSFHNDTIKVEGLEKYSPTLNSVLVKLSDFLKHEGPVTAHLFLAKENSNAFGLHEDLETVLVYVLEGTKRMLVIEEGLEKLYTIPKGSALLIPRNTLHKAVNVEASTILSIGFEEWLYERLL